MLLDIIDEPKQTKKASQTPSYAFICGADDYIVSRQGKQLFEQAAQHIKDDFSKEIIDGAAQNLAEVETAVNRFVSAVQTVSLFGDQKVVWFKGINFLADSVTGRSEGAKAQVERIQQVLNQLDPNQVKVIITASPIDRRTKAFKTLQKNADYQFLEGGNDAQALKKIVLHECKQFSVEISHTALEVLLAKVGPNSRLLIEEIRKLATYIGANGEKIKENLVHEMVPQFGEGDFFEVTEAFFSFDLKWTLQALERHFFTQKESRPILSALQNRNRILIQLRVLLDSGELKIGPRGPNKTVLESLAQEYQFTLDPKTKSSHNLFTQNPWYLGKLVTAAKKVSLKKLLDFQETFIEGFQGILNFPNNQATTIERMVTKCLS